MPKKTVPPTPTPPPKREVRPVTVAELTNFLLGQKNIGNAPVLLAVDSEGNAYSALAITSEGDKNTLNASIEKMVPEHGDRQALLWEPPATKKPPKTAQTCLVLFPST